VFHVHDVDDDRRARCQHALHSVERLLHVVEVVRVRALPGVVLERVALHSLDRERRRRERAVAGRELVGIEFQYVAGHHVLARVDGVSDVLDTVGFVLDAVRYPVQSFRDAERRAEPRKRVEDVVTRFGVLAEEALDEDVRGSDLVGVPR
jgi:hypothetical protein